MFTASWEDGKYGDLQYSEGAVRQIKPYVFKVELNVWTGSYCEQDFVGVFYPDAAGSFKLLGFAQDSFAQIYDVECGWGQFFIIIGNKAYLATRNKDGNITQVDRLKSVECQNVGKICDEQTFAMSKYPQGVK